MNRKTVLRGIHNRTSRCSMIVSHNNLRTSTSKTDYKIHALCLYQLVPLWLIWSYCACICRYVLIRPVRVGVAGYHSPSPIILLSIGYKSTATALLCAVLYHCCIDSSLGAEPTNALIYIATRTGTEMQYYTSKRTTRALRYS